MPSSLPMYFVKKIPTGCGSADEGNPSYEKEFLKTEPARFTYEAAQKRAAHYNGMMNGSCIASVVPAF